MISKPVVGKTYRKQGSFQRGVATLLTSVVVLFIVTLMVIFAARVSLFDQRMSANEIRQKEAFAMAEAGLDFAMQRFSQTFRADESPIENIIPIVAAATVDVLTRPNGQPATEGFGGFTVEIEDTGVDYGDVPVFEFTANGEGADGTGSSTIRLQATMVHVLRGGGRGPDVPIIVSGEVGTGGSFSVVANPNAGGPGVPVSIWSDEVIAVTSSSATCHAEFYAGTKCSNRAEENITPPNNPQMDLSEYSSSAPDLLPNDPDFPDDLFEFLFGLERTSWEVLRARAEGFGQSVQDCGAIEALGADAGQSFPLWWVEGDCTMNGGAIIGSQDRPVILVIDESEFKFTGNGTVAGIVFLFDNPDRDDFANKDAFAGGAEIFGSVVSDWGGEKLKGNFSVVYSPDVLNAIGGDTGGGINYTMGHIPGSWLDF